LVTQGQLSHVCDNNQNDFMQHKAYHADSQLYDITLFVFSVTTLKNKMQTQKKFKMKQRLLCRVSLKLIPISHDKGQVLEVGQSLTVSPKQITLL
jgi:hypothetical protein